MAISCAAPGHSEGCCSQCAVCSSGRGGVRGDSEKSAVAHPSGRPCVVSEVGKWLQILEYVREMYVGEVNVIENNYSSVFRYQCRYIRYMFRQLKVFIRVNIRL